MQGAGTTNGAMLIRNPSDPFGVPYHIRSLGFSVLRFWTYEVAKDIDGVCEAVLAAIDGRLEPSDRYTRP